MEKIPGTASRVGPSEQSFERVAKDQQRRKDSVPNCKADVALSGYKTSIACTYADFRSREP